MKIPCLFCWTQNLDDWFDYELPKLQEAFINRLLEAIRYHWNTNTLLCVVLLMLMGLWFWIFGVRICRRKWRQRKWRRRMK